MKKKTIIISGIATVLVIGSVVFCFAVKGDSTQPTEIAQTVTEAVATPTIEIPEEEPEVVEEIQEVAEVVEETPEETPEVVEEEETSETEGSIVEVADSDSVGVEETSEEVSPAVEETEPTQPEQAQEVAKVQPTETQPQQTQPNQSTVDEQRDAIVAQLNAMGANWGISDDTSVLGHNTDYSIGAGMQWE